MTYRQKEVYKRHKAIYEWRKANPDAKWNEACYRFEVGPDAVRNAYARYAAHLVTGEPYFKESPLKGKIMPQREKPVKLGRKLANPDAEWARLGVRF